MDPVASPCCGNLFRAPASTRRCATAPCVLCAAQTSAIVRPPFQPPQWRRVGHKRAVQQGRGLPREREKRDDPNTSLTTWSRGCQRGRRRHPALPKRGLTDWPLVGLVGSAKIHLDVISTGAVKAIFAEQRVVRICIQVRVFGGDLTPPASGRPGKRVRLPRKDSSDSKPRRTSLAFFRVRIAHACRTTYQCQPKPEERAPSVAPGIGNAQR